MVKIFNKSDNPIKEVTKKFFLKIKEETINEEEKSVIAVVSDASVDAHHESISLDAWETKDLKNFINTGGMFLSRHDMGWLNPTLLSQIGYISKVWVDKQTEQVLAKFHWLAGKGNPEADWGWVLASLGTAAFSVGVRVLEYMEQEITENEWKNYSKAFRTYLKVSLKEISQVLFPANNNARMSAVKSADPFIKEYGQRITNKNVLEVSGAKTYAEYIEEKGISIKSEENEPVVVNFEEEELKKAIEAGYIKKEENMNKETTLDTIKTSLEKLSKMIETHEKGEGELPEDVIVIEKTDNKKINKESDLDVQKKLDLILESLESIKDSIKKTDARVSLLLDSSTKEEVKKTTVQEAQTYLGKIFKGINTANTTILGSVSAKSQSEKSET